MSLKEQLAADLKDAMKNRQTVRKNTVQMVRAAILQYEKDNKAELDDAGVTDIVAKELKRRRDVLPDYEKSGRDDLIAELREEMQVLLSYLPEQLSEDELNSIVSAAIAQTGAATIKDMGKVMGLVVGQTKGRADAKLVGELVKKALNQN